jgi:hypothetical protein
VVQNVPLIPQDKGMACWYATAQMLIGWRRNSYRACEMGLPDPSDVPDLVNTYKANNGLSIGQMVQFAKLMGLAAVPPMCPTLDAIDNWLHDYGPIWAAGLKKTATSSYGHAFVIAGVGMDELFVHDPEPLNVGTAEWKPQTWLATLLSTGADWNMAFNFLHIPF